MTWPQRRASLASRSRVLLHTARLGGRASPTANVARQQNAVVAEDLMDDAGVFAELTGALTTAERHADRGRLRQLVDPKLQFRRDGRVVNLEEFLGDLDDPGYRNDLLEADEPGRRDRGRCRRARYSRVSRTRTAPSSSPRCTRVSLQAGTSDGRTASVPRTRTFPRGTTRSRRQVPLRSRRPPSRTGACESSCRDGSGTVPIQADALDANRSVLKELKAAAGDRQQGETCAAWPASSNPVRIPARGATPSCANRDGAQPLSSPMSAALRSAAVRCRAPRRR
jgi:hypothetical protein